MRRLPRVLPRSMRDEYPETREKCLAAVRRDGMELQHIENQTEEISLEAVSENGLALIHVQDQTPMICAVAIENHPSAAQYVRIDFNYKTELAIARAYSAGRRAGAKYAMTGIFAQNTQFTTEALERAYNQGWGRGLDAA